VRGRDLPLSGHTTITEQDRSYARGGARSRLLVGKTFTNHDLLRAMLVASDNRAVTAVARGAGLTPEELVSALNEKARELGLKKTVFADPTGLHGNVSTPRETAIALRAALDDPVLAEILATPTAVVTSVDEPRVAIWYVNTNVSLRAGRYAVLGGKTGYTDEARYCLAIATRIADRRIGMVFLGAEGELTRFGDFNRSAGWLASSSPTVPRGNKDRPGGEGDVGAAADPPPPALTPRLGR
jgi:D-alanyl-D-alanine endopeptidase (penicillin-binding protein 7)